MKLYKILHTKIITLINKKKIDSNELNFIKFNKQKWGGHYFQKNRGIILIDFFEHYPFIYFWSYIANIFSRKKNIQIKYFYFKFYNSIYSKYHFFLKKLKIIYESFNCSEGINEINFNYSIKEINKSKKIFKNITSKEKLIKYKINNIQVGHLIYDSYLRTYFKPTVDMNDERILNIFIRARKIFQELNDYFKKNEIKLIITSHTNYIQFGIITKLAIKNNIPVIKIFSRNRGTTGFRLKLIEKKFGLEENNYFNYKSDFKKINNKKLALSLGKKLIQKRLSGKYDENLPHMEKSAYKKDNKQKIKLNYEKQYKNIIIFSHCFFDSPHRFRYLIFNDFYEQINFFLEWLNNNSDYKIFIKQHPNDLPENKYIFDSLINQNKKSNIVFVDKEINNFQLLKLKPKFAITNYGTIAHEYAYLGIPVINTGDNPHINYNFNIHAKTKENLNHILCNIDFYIKKINFNKNNIYEYIFMHYVYSTNEFNEKKFLSEEFFFSKNSTINSNSNLFNYYLKNKNIHSKKIEKYINYFLRKNNLI